MRILSTNLCVFVFTFNFALAQITSVALSRKANPSIVEKLSHKRPQFNYDEAKVPTYELPDALTLNSGDAVTDADAWMNIRRGDPKSEFLSLVHAQPAYDLFGVKAIGHETVADPDLTLHVSPPPLNRPLVFGPTGYPIGAGPHGLTQVDRARFLDFADVRFK